MNRKEVLYPTAGPSHVLNWPDAVLKGYVTFVPMSRMEDWHQHSWLGLPFFEDLNWLQGKGCLMGRTVYLENINCFWNRKTFKCIACFKTKRIQMNQTMCNLEKPDSYPRSQPAGIFHILEELFYPFPVSQERVTAHCCRSPDMKTASSSDSTAKMRATALL